MCCAMTAWLRCFADENDTNGSGVSHLYNPVPSSVSCTPRSSCGPFAMKKGGVREEQSGSYLLTGAQACLPFAPWQLPHLPPSGNE